MLIQRISLTLWVSNSIIHPFLKGPLDHIQCPYLAYEYHSSFFSMLCLSKLNGLCDGRLMAVQLCFVTC